MLSLFTPMLLYARSFPAVKVPGLHSTVISASSDTEKASRTAPIIFTNNCAGRIDGVPPPKNIVLMLLSSPFFSASFPACTISAHRALTYRSFVSSSAGAEQKSQYIHFEMQKGICIYIPFCVFISQLIQTSFIS